MNLRHWIIPAYLFLCGLLGGASLGGYPANLVLELLAVPIIFWSLVTVRRTPIGGPARSMMVILALSVAVILVQLIPLPPSWWTALPGRAVAAEAYALVGEELPWLPISLAPERTFASLIWWLPAFAVLLGMIRLGAFQPRYVVFALLGFAMLSVVIGAGQVASGSQSPLYFYQVTNRGFAVGTFANNNHMATLLLIAIPFLFAMQSKGGGRRRSPHRSSAANLVLVAMLLVVAVGLAINTSLAGIGLAVPVAVASLLIRRRAKKLPIWVMPTVAVAAAASVALVLLAPMGNNLFGDQENKAESRQVSIPRTAEAAVQYAPLGSGLGTFALVYQINEDPAEVTRTWMNHAHSDLTEWLLETGVPGAILLVLFLVWWVRQTVRIWRERERPDLFARAATIASAAILAHSLVDYPLRTAAIAAIFAMLLALMADAKPKVDARRGGRSETSSGDGPRHLSA